MKILFISSLYLPNVGGVETTIEELAKVYLKKGHEVNILTKRYPASLEEFEKINEANIYRVHSASDNNFQESINFLAKTESQMKSDIVHLIGIRRHMPLFALMLSKLWKVPLLTTFSGGDVLTPEDDQTMKLWDEGKNTVPQSVYQSDGFTTFSKSTRQDALNCLPKLSEVDVVYGGLNVTEIQKAKPYKPTKKRRYIVSIRRLLYSKGVDLLITAFSKINDLFPDLDLYIIGDGPELENLKSLSKTLGLGGRVIFWGRLSHPETLPYLRGSIACICPSRSEGGGLINFEAQAAGSVSIGSNAGGIPEYIKDKETGFLFKSEDVEDLTGILKLALSNVPFRKKIIRNALENIRQYDWNEIANKQLEHYQEMINGYQYKKFKTWSTQSKKLWEDLIKGVL